MGNRINWIDCVKGFAMISVVWGHTGLPVEVRSVLHSINMPLFFFLSGLFLYSKNRTIREELLKKIKTILFPWLIFSLILLLWHYLGHAFFVGDQDINRDIFLPLGNMFKGYSELWFFPCIFLSECLILPFAKFRRQTKNFWLYISMIFAILGIIVSFIFRTTPLPYSLDIVLMASSFVTLGMFSHENTFRYKNYQYLIVALVYIIFLILSLKSTDGLGIDMNTNRFGNYAYFYIASISIIFLIINFFRRYSNSKILIFYGRNTLIIYSLHIIPMNIMSRVLNYAGLFNSDSFTVLLVKSIVMLIGVGILILPFIFIIKKYFPWTMGKFGR